MRVVFSSSSSAGDWGCACLGRFSVCRFPGMKPSESATAAAQDASRQASGQPPERPKMLAL